MEIAGQQVPNDTIVVNGHLERLKKGTAPFTVCFAPVVSNAASNGGPMAVSMDKAKSTAVPVAQPVRRTSKRIGFAQAMKVRV